MNTSSSQLKNFPTAWPSSKADRCAAHTLPIHPEEISLPVLFAIGGVPPARDARTPKPPSAPPSFPRVPYRLRRVARTHEPSAYLRPGELPSPLPAPQDADLSAHRRALNSLHSVFLPRCVPIDVRRALFAVLEIIYFLRNQIAAEQPFRFRCNCRKRFFQVLAVAGNADYAHLRALP